MKHPMILRLSTLGLFGAALAWMFHQQAGYLLAAYGCGKHEAWFLPVSAAAILALLIAAMLSFRGSRQDKAALTDGQPRRFMAWIGLTGACVLGFAVLMQASAATILPACTP